MDEMKGLRVVGKVMEAAVQTWHGPGDRTITLASCPHLAEAQFYVELREIVDKLEADGDEVHHEGVMDRANMNDAAVNMSKDVAAGIGAQFEGLPALFDLPWVYQENSAMQTGPTWQNFDASMPNMVRLLGPAFTQVVPLAPMANRIEELIARKGTDSIAYNNERVKFVNSYLLSVKAFPERKPLRARLFGPWLGRLVSRIALPAEGRDATAVAWMQPYLLFYRECIAITAALAAPGNVVMVWNGMHFPHFAKVLKRNDFALTNTEWLRVVQGLTLTGRLPEQRKA